jgi:hypothetical protein
MKKSKLLVLGLIALMLAGGLALASCGVECGGGCGESRCCCYSGCGGKNLCDCVKRVQDYNQGTGMGMVKIDEVHNTDSEQFNETEEASKDN